MGGKARVEIRRCMVLVENIEAGVRKEKLLLLTRKRLPETTADNSGPIENVEDEKVSRAFARAVSEEPSANRYPLGYQKPRTSSVRPRIQPARLQLSAWLAAKNYSVQGY